MDLSGTLSFVLGGGGVRRGRVAGPGSLLRGAHVLPIVEEHSGWVYLER